MVKTKYYVGEKEFDNLEEAEAYEKEIAERKLKEKALLKEKEDKKKTLEEMIKSFKELYDGYVKEYNEKPVLNLPSGFGFNFFTDFNDDYDLHGGLGVTGISDIKKDDFVDGLKWLEDFFNVKTK